MKKISFFLRDSNPQWHPYNQILSKIQPSYQIVYAFSYTISNIILNNFNDYHELISMNEITKNIDVLTIVFIAQLVERLDNFFLFPKDVKLVQTWC